SELEDDLLSQPAHVLVVEGGGDDHGIGASARAHIRGMQRIAVAVPQATGEQAGPRLAGRWGRGPGSRLGKLLGELLDAGRDLAGRSVEPAKGSVAQGPGDQVQVGAQGGVGGYGVSPGSRPRASAAARLMRRAASAAGR